MLENYHDNNDILMSEYWELYSHRNSVNKPYIEITYDDIPPGNPNSLYPENTTLNPRDIIRFSWLHNSPEGLLQKSFTLQYSINAGATWATVNQTTANQYYDMPASTLPTSGTVLWKVMTTDTNSAASGYTTTSFTLGGSASESTYTCSAYKSVYGPNKGNKI